MIDFEITQEELAQAADHMTKARASQQNDLVDFTAYTDNVKFVVVGRELTCPAIVASPGAAQIPIETMEKVSAVAQTYGVEAVRIRIEEGRMRINTMAVTSPNITLKPIGDRMIDIPDDAPLRDVLALKYLFTPLEVAQSNLTSRWLAANSTYLKTMDRACLELAPLGITVDQLEALAISALKTHAETLRPMLRPPLTSDRLN